ncbi:MAG TPA: biotin--[acetyl-CoA-carboxylase] ligase [Solirubrobacteraceae bacterium]|jgi:BirA family biotin operon repressor/biotin-[acetyl-CoA-carboxylase] ligase
MTLGSPRVHRRRTGSTSVDARELAIAGAPHGTLVSAAEQLDGRGRQGRRWHAPAGSALLCSLVLRDPPRLLALAAGVAVAETIGEEATLKWPNDVLLDGRKVSGILIEGRPQECWSVLGIGINVALRIEDLPAELGASAGTLGRAQSDVEPLLERLLGVLEARLSAPEGELLAAWRARDALLGREVSWRDGRGTAAGIDDTGALLVRLAGGDERALDAGEVHLLAG